jgi:hypothetical protein
MKGAIDNAKIKIAIGIPQTTTVSNPHPILQMNQIPNSLMIIQTQAMPGMR